MAVWDDSPYKMNIERIKEGLDMAVHAFNTFSLRGDSFEHHQVISDFLGTHPNKAFGRN